MKTQDVPLPLRDFYETFRKVEYRHNYITVFDDFLTALMNYFTPPNEKPYDIACFNKYSQEERMLFSEMIRKIILAYDREVTDSRKWFDPFGDFYQALASRSKQSALGQFFTPDSVVDMMVDLTGPQGEDITGKGLRISDPTCGSGRLLIAFYAKHPGNYVYGEDLDPMCCKMACINLMFHGCEGEIVNHNSLNPDHYINGWKINSDIRRTGLPSIRPMLQEQSFICQMWKIKREEAEQNSTVTAPPVSAKKSKRQQLEIFNF